MRKIQYAEFEFDWFFLFFSNESGIPLAPSIAVSVQRPGAGLLGPIMNDSIVGNREVGLIFRVLNGLHEESRGVKSVYLIRSFLAVFLNPRVRSPS